MIDGKGAFLDYLSGVFRDLIVDARDLRLVSFMESPNNFRGLRAMIACDARVGGPCFGPPPRRDTSSEDRAREELLIKEYDCKLDAAIVLFKSYELIHGFDADIEERLIKVNDLVNGMRDDYYSLLLLDNILL